jgi:hypothetical protein
MRRILKTLIHPGLGSFNRAGFCLSVTVKLLKPILNWTQLLPIILKPRDDNRPAPSICDSVRNCRNDNAVVLIEKTGHREFLAQATGPGWPLKRERSLFEMILRLLCDKKVEQIR